ncbi:predicted protein [Chaetomium globosum CBS 148.51]|uniref:Uncharacterized protein n=1 Tax=Chaetomium globosum (strain ATCC 6205 / CBS 148.51 / DSM 1962 / NBRC 6347 / NRRL 1970) TaxID=306901 RepID=Q2H4Y2_CHAGB|nr:uncharacterized protein CHGG_06283 [Chaetomium globosum CBS 148.51]EAQ89664.1 predicted protein [Chaetomium globosum CBS 148.51]
MGNPKKSTHRDSDDMTSTKSLAITAPGFNGILDFLDPKPPKKLEDIRERLQSHGQLRHLLSQFYARNQALAYQRKFDPLNHASVITSTTDGTTLNQYAHYAEELEDGTTKYHQYRIKSTNPNSHEDFKDGYKRLRNAQDYAKGQSYILKDELQGHWKQQRSSGRNVITEGPRGTDLACTRHRTSIYKRMMTITKS